MADKYLEVVWPNHTRPDIVDLEARFADWQKDFIVLNDGETVDEATGRDYYEKYTECVVTEGETIYLVRPSNVLWWKIFWDQVKRIGKDNILALTGRAGTGKTTWLKQYIQNQEIKSRDIHICAPTGVACARLKSALFTLGADYSKKIKTPHAEFRTSVKAADGTFRQAGLPGWAYNWKPKKSKKKVFILDEAGNTDLRTMTLMLMKVPTGSKLVLSGDCDQLQPVGYGSPYRALLDMTPGLPPQNRVNLTTVYRVFDGSEALGSAVESILDKHQWPADGPGIETIVMDDYQSLHEKVLGLMDQGYQCLTSTNALSIGFGRGHSQMRQLRRKLSMNRKKRRAYDERDMYLMPGDKVRILVSDYTKGYYNGSIGTYIKWIPSRLAHIVELDESGDAGSKKVVKIKVPEEVWSKIEQVKTVEELRNEKTFSEEDIERMFDSAQAGAAKGMMIHAESLTIHRAQGSEWDNVVVVIPWASRMLSQSLLYVAITRARRNCKIILMKGKDGSDVMPETAKAFSLRKPEVSPTFRGNC